MIDSHSKLIDSSGKSPAWVVGVDIGGTFTDMVVMDSEGHSSTYKTPTTSDDLITGLMTNAQAAAEEQGEDIDNFFAATTRIAHGTTAATNAYIERRGAKVALLTTRGFEDTIFMQRMLGMTAGLSASELTDYSLRRVPRPICSRSLVFGLRERIDYRGEVMGELQEQDVYDAITVMKSAGVEAVAVSFLWSFKNDSHERRVAEILTEEFPEAYLSISCELVPRLGEYERTATTLVNAHLGPPMKRYSRSLSERLPGEKLVLLDSSGGVMSPAQASASPIRLLLSGPSGGVTAARYVSESLGHSKVLTFDMGGTSADVGLIVDGEVTQRYETESGGYHLLLPMIDVRAIGAGGGSIARVEEGGYLRIGPESAGAEPGPACYGRGGEMPTVTDADLVLGILDPANFLGGRLTVSVDAAREAIRREVAQPLQISVEDAAIGIKQIVDARMADLLRTVTLERGHDPREFVLYAFGGAGASHAPAFSLDLVEALVVPTNQAVLCAFGAIASDMVITGERSVPMRISRKSGGADADFAQIESAFSEMESRGCKSLLRQQISRENQHAVRIAEVRFARQTKSLSIPMRSGIVELLQDFLKAYAVRYGTEAVPERSNFELVTLVSEISGQLPRPELALKERGGSDPGRALLGERSVYDPSIGGFTSTAIYDGDALRPENRIEGPAIVQFPDTTIVVGGDQRAVIDRYLNIEIRKAR